MAYNSAVKALTKRRFEALAGYTRDPKILLLVQEFDWFTTNDERVLGLLVWDRVDYDFGWVAFGRDEQKKYRFINGNASYPSAETAREALIEAMIEASKKPDEAFYQDDADGPTMDFFTAVVAEDKIHRIMRVLQTEQRYSPARGLITAMMPYFHDADGNFIEQFQTSAFDARLWELYLFATFNELDYAQSNDFAIPDLMLTSVRGQIGVEATTINASNESGVPLPTTPDELIDYVENYVPIKLARAMKKKLRKLYWEEPHMKGVPFVMAVQDFHSPGAMQKIVTAMTEYVFGIRHHLEDGKVVAEAIKGHKFGKLSERSGFFSLANSEHVSAVIINPQGTLTKFNRMGFLAGFGHPDVKMIKRGIQRQEHLSDNPRPSYFVHKVYEPGFNETWVEGMVVLHNPHALIPLDPEFIPGAAHEFLQDDGNIMSIIPEFHPLFSETAIIIDKTDQALVDPHN